MRLLICNSTLAAVHHFSDECTWRRFGDCVRPHGEDGLGQGALRQLGLLELFGGQQNPRVRHHSLGRAHQRHRYTGHGGAASP